MRTEHATIHATLYDFKHASSTLQGQANIHFLWRVYNRKAGGGKKGKKGKKSKKGSKKKKK
jgi:hypothetical protein